MLFKKEYTTSFTDGALKESELKKFTLEELRSYLETINKERELSPSSYPVIENAYFEDIILKNVCLKDIAFRNCKFKNCMISDSNLTGTEFMNVSFEHVVFTKNNMKLVGYFVSRLKSVEMNRCVMLESEFGETSFEDVTIYKSNLDNSSVVESNFNNIRLIGNSGTLLNCPEEGSFIGFKGLCSKNGRNLFICKLEIPIDAKRSSAFGRKCRCSKAKVLEILAVDDEYNFTIPVEKGFSLHESGFEYKVGEMVYPDSFDDNRWIECSNGIHFFMTKQEAIDYWH